MAEPEDILVKILNLDAEIRCCVACLASIGGGAEDCLVPWVKEERARAQARLTQLRKRREVHFLALNELVARQSPIRRRRATETARDLNGPFPIREVNLSNLARKTG
ncbi:hypothetical protein AB4Y42_31110 [Paraburkholderia sp. EG286B]|uniref:hypothetical protein n=1 Tax=Paraburkholderia sp. EG286B TaxID=3237011 RepID=UPI0034D17863